jgi:hypothetical protein
MQFGDDWPGIFLRGDDAFNYAYHLERLLELTRETHQVEVAISRGVLAGLLTDLRSVVVGAEGNEKLVQQLKAFEECVPKPACSGCGKILVGPHACPGRKP